MYTHVHNSSFIIINYNSFTLTLIFAKGAINTTFTSTPVILSQSGKLNSNVAQDLCLTGSASHHAYGQVSHIFTKQYNEQN